MSDQPHPVPAGPIVSFGSVNVDVTAYPDRLPSPGQTVHASRYALGLGGKGANQAAAAARLGQPAELAGRTGDDAFARLARDALARFGVGTRCLGTDPAHPTGIALIGVEASGENAIIVAGGANAVLDRSDVARAGDLLDRARVLLLQLEVPAAASLEAALRARAAGATIILDPAPAPTEPLPEALWRAIDLVTPNETETEALVGLRPRDAAEAQVAAGRLLALGARCAVVKLGARGVAYRSATEAGFVPPFRVVPIDTVAAGDCFNAGLAVALARGATLAEAVRFAAACGALATTRPGAAEAAPDLAEVQALLADQPGSGDAGFR